MQTHPFHLLSLLLVTTNTVQSAQPFAFDQHDEFYVSSLRKQLDSFHENLSQGKISANGEMCAEMYIGILTEICSFRARNGRML